MKNESPMRPEGKSEGRRTKSEVGRASRPEPKSFFKKARALAKRSGATSTFVLLTSSFVLSACTLIETRPDPSKFYVLDTPASTKPAGKTWPFALAVARVQTPSYLDQVQIVSRTEDAGVTFSEFNRWLEPVDKGATRVFSTALASRLGADRVALEPALDVYRDGVLVQLQLLRLDGELGGKIIASGRWRVSSVRSSETLATGEAVVEEPCTGRDYRSYSAALSRALDKLAAKTAGTMQDIRADKDGMPTK